MEYPGSIFKRPIRLAMLICFFAAFFIISPLVIIYSAGYRFDFKNGLLRETGSLSVDVLPKTTLVYLDGLKIDQTIPIRLNNITPHKYSIRLSSPGYYDWEKQIEVNKNKTTYIKELILLKKEKPKKLLNDTAANISISPSGKYLLYSVVLKNITKIMLLETGGTEAKNLVNIQNINPVDFSWSNNGDYAAISSAEPPYQELFVVDATAPDKIFDIANKKNIDKFIWGKDSEPKLYFGTSGAVYNYLPRIQQTGKVSSSTYQDWYLDEGSLWTIDYSTTSNRLIIFTDTLGFKNIFASVMDSSAEPSSSLKNVSIASAKKGVVVLKDSEAQKYLIVNKEKYFTVNANNLLYSKFGNWLILWSPWEIWTFTENDEPYLLNRSGEQLRGLIPLDEYNTLALIWQNEVTALHPYFFTERQLIDSKIEKMSVDIINRIIYFSNAEGIWKLNY